MQRYAIRKACTNDLADLVRIYNANPDFLHHHLGHPSVDHDFIRHEMEEMEKSGFLSCVVVHAHSKEIVGVLDYKPDATVYLSLMMIDGKLHGKGIGSGVYLQFENDMIRQGKQAVRMDVVDDYGRHVVPFWKRHGFLVQGETTLCWGKKRSHALIMGKILAKSERRGEC